MNLGWGAYSCAAIRGFCCFTVFEESFTGCRSMLNFNKYS